MRERLKHRDFEDRSLLRRNAGKDGVSWKRKTDGGDFEIEQAIHIGDKEYMVLVER